MEFKLDRSAFKASDAKNQVNYGEEYRGKSPMELLAIAFYLNSLAYGFSLDNPPRMDKTAFSARKR
jgi:hypothetical protein